MPTPTNRPTELTNAIALARQSVVYCSGSQSVYIAKFAPPRPRKKMHTNSQGSAFAAM